jgi:hypothetical protein
MAVAPEILVMEAVAAVVEDTFSAEGYTVEYDRLGRSAGMEITEGARVAISMDPNQAVEERPGRVIELRTPILLQLYHAYTAEPDETIVVDPRIIAAEGQRLREAFRDGSGLSDGTWYMRLTAVQYPNDPTGNASRLEARIVGFGENPAGLPPA